MNATTYTPPAFEHRPYILHLQDLIVAHSRFSFVVAALATLILVLYIDYRGPWVNVPVVGLPSGPFSTWRAALKSTKHLREYIQEGYAKFSPTGTPFQIPTVPRYLVFITDVDQIEELRKAKDDELNFDRALDNMLKMKLTLDPLLGQPGNLYHVDVIRQRLTNRLASVLPDVMEEMDLVWRDETNIGDDWTRLHIRQVLFDIVARTTNRLFVGVPLCRNKEYLEIMASFAKVAIGAGQRADHLPSFLQRLAIWFMLNRNQHKARAKKFLVPMFEERRRMLREGAWEGRENEKPDDAIQWLLEMAPKQEQTNDQLVAKMFLLNLGAIHTTCLSLTHVLYHLATNPSFIQPTREDALAALSKHGGKFTKQCLTDMKKLDSILRESQRYSSSNLTMTRLVLKPYTFKTGRVPLTLPRGATVCAPTSGLHHDNDFYPNANAWDGFRFSKIREEVEGESAKHQMVSTSKTYLTFGHGRRSCPGRFFVANELKLILSYLLLRYEIRLGEEWEGKRPQDVHSFGDNLPNPNAMLEFRKRKDYATEI